MGILQKAMQTYDAMQHLVGVEVEGKEVLAPVGHIVTNAKIVITIDDEGHFIQAGATDAKIAIPVTEESSGRTSGVAPHPLCEQIGYLTGIDADKTAKYVAQLQDWADSEDTHPALLPVLTYVKGGTLQKDLIAADLLKYDDNCVIKNDKDLICWIVNGIGTQSGPVWKNRTLQQAYTSYYIRSRTGNGRKFCALTGEVTMPASQHLKGIVSLNGNAKIISANDTSNFTYRGRFISPDEALTIGYEASQKAHNALKWVVANQAAIEGGRAFICWNPNGYAIPHIVSPILPAEEEARKPTDYVEQLKKTIDGYKQKLPAGEDVVIAAFDAATSGRLAIAYYNELKGSDFLDRLAYWDSTCCWYDNQLGVVSPLLYNIVNYAFGTLRGEKIDTDPKVMAQHIQRLIACRIDAGIFPQDITRALVCKAGNLQIYAPALRRRLLFTACAIIRKFRTDRYKEEWSMALQPDLPDRSYQFGRLLAVLEKAERDTYDRDESRETNAIRMQAVFTQRPGYASKVVVDQLKTGYYPRLTPGQRVFYDRLIGEILGIISDCGLDEYNKPLSETYLLGYYLQKNALYSKKEDNDSDTSE